MIYFFQELFIQAEKTAIEAKDLHDTVIDLNQIKSAIDSITLPNGLKHAHELNIEMRQKHPIIDEMLRIANNMPRGSAPVTVSTTPNKESNEVISLRQDYCGILCEVLLKKGITNSVEQFIEKVD